MLKALRAGITQGKIVPVLCAAAAKGIGSPRAARPDRATSSRRRLDRGDVAGTDLKTKQAGVRAPRCQGAGDRAGLQDAERSTHRQAVAVPRVLGHPAEPIHACSTPRGAAASAWATSAWLQGKNAEERGGAGAGRDRRGAQAQGHADRRHALRGGAALRAAAHHLPRAGDQLRHPAQDARRRGQDLHRAGPHRRGRPDRPPPLRPRDQAAPDLRAWAACTWRWWSSA